MSRNEYCYALRAVLAFGVYLTFAGGSQVAEAQESPSFEVASVKRAAAGELLTRRLEIDPVRFYARAGSLRYLTAEAYGIENYQLLRTSGWMDADLYSVAAVSSRPVDRNEMLAMLRTLLSERFQLRVHRETRRTKVFALVPAKSGSKLQPLGDGQSAPTRPSVPAANQVTVSAGTTISELVTFLNLRSGTAALGRPVVDHTGIRGRFRIWLTFNLETDPDGRSGRASMDYFEALPQQLGLRLEPTEEQCSFLIVDTAERP